MNTQSLAYPKLQGGVFSKLPQRLLPYLAKGLETLAVLLGVAIGTAKGSVLILTSVAHQLQSSGGRKRLLYGEPSREPSNSLPPRNNAVTYESAAPVPTPKTFDTNPLFVPDASKSVNGTVKTHVGFTPPDAKAANIQPLTTPAVDTKKEVTKGPVVPPTPTPSPMVAKPAVPAIPIVTEVHSKAATNGHAQLHNERILATDQSLAASEVHSTAEADDNEEEDDGYTDETGSIMSQETTPRSTTEGVAAPKKKVRKTKKIINKLKKVFT